MQWIIIDSGSDTAAAVMGKDALLLQQLEEQQQPLLHFYSWAFPAATHGYFLDPKKVLLSVEGLDLGRRVTGGGVTLHVTDLAFSVLVPATHHSYHPGDVLKQYQFVNHLAAKALHAIFPDTYQMIQEHDASLLTEFCMTKGTKYDVLCRGKKAIGAAQRTKKFGYLQQLTISLALPQRTFLERYFPQPVVEKMLTFTHAPLGNDISGLEEARQAVKTKLAQIFQEET